MAVEAAKKRQRARDVGLMDRAFRQVTARQKSGRAAKARYNLPPDSQFDIFNSRRGSRLNPTAPPSGLSFHKNMKNNLGWKNAGLKLFALSFEIPLPQQQYRRRLWSIPQLHGQGQEKADGRHAVDLVGI